jgi:E3 ubiquitin-protein ligase DOA10
MSTEEDEEHRNFIEAKIIIQEFHDDPTVFIVGTAPFGKLWFDQDKITQQYKVLTDTWHEEYGDAETKHSKRPRIINVLLDEKDAMFNKYRDNIREAQEKKQQEEEAEKSQQKMSDTNEINININVDSIPTLPTPKKTTKTPKTKATKKNDTGKSTPSESPTESPVKKRGRPKKQQTDIKGAFTAASTTTK